MTIQAKEDIIYAFQVSVIIINYNTQELTVQCIRSVYSSNLSIENLEIIVIDNGSSEKVEKNLDILFPEIIFIQLTDNLGFAKANNIGIANARGEYILLLNSDVVIKEDDLIFNCIKKIVSFDFPVILTPELKTVDGATQTAYGRLSSINQELFYFSCLHKILPNKILEKLLIKFSAQEDRVIRKGWLVATCLFIPKELIQKLPDGKLYDDTFLYGEELHWGYDWNKLCIKQIYFSNASIIHLIGQSTKKANEEIPKRRVYQVYGEMMYIKRIYGRIYFYMFFYIRLLRLYLLPKKDKNIRNLIFLTKKVLSNSLVENFPFLDPK